MAIALAAEMVAMTKIVVMVKVPCNLGIKSTTPAEMATKITRSTFDFQYQKKNMSVKTVTRAARPEIRAINFAGCCLLINSPRTNEVRARTQIPLSASAQEILKTGWSTLR
jgi:hypothetical protein